MAAQDSTVRMDGSLDADSPGILLDAGTNEVEILVFQVGDHLCGVNVAKVREVHTVKRPTFLPQLPDSLEGMIRIRNAVVPTVDLHKYLWGSTRKGRQLDERHLLLEYNNQMIAFRVEGVGRVHRVSWANILPVPQGLGKNVSMTGIVLLEGKIITLLDFESIGARLGICGITEFLGGESIESPFDAAQFRLVFADDSVLIRRMAEDVLSQVGYENVQIFEDGLEAWEYLAEVAENNSVDSVRDAVSVIVTDVEMPRMDGFSLTKNIRQDPVLRELPVVLFSSLVSRDNEKKGEQVGATVQVAKPNWEDLAATLSTILDGSPQA